MQIRRAVRKPTRRIVANPRRAANPARVIRPGVHGHHPTPKDPRVYPQYPIVYGMDLPVEERLPQAGRYSRKGVPVTRQVQTHPLTPHVQRTGYDTYPAAVSVENLSRARARGLGVWYDPRTWEAPDTPNPGNTKIPGTDITFNQIQQYWPQIKQSISIMDWMPGKIQELEAAYVDGAGTPEQRSWWATEVRPKWNQIQQGWGKVTNLYNLAKQYVPGLSGTRGRNQNRRPLALTTRKTGLGFVTIAVIVIVLLVIALAAAIYNFGFAAGEEAGSPPGAIDVPEVVPDSFGPRHGGPGGPGGNGRGIPTYGPGVNNMFWFKAGTVEHDVTPLQVAEPEQKTNFSDKPKIHALNPPAGGGRVVLDNPEMEVREYLEGEIPLALARNQGKRVERDWWITPGWDTNIPLINDDWEKFGGDALNAVLIGGVTLIGLGIFFRFAGGLL